MLGDIERLLKDEIGLDSESVGLSVIRHALRERMLATGIADAQRYWTMVSTSRAEVQQLIDAVIVPETWFFRDREAFAGMARYARTDIKRRPIRLLSLPCSTGEEAYTMAMAMFDAGFGPEDFVVEARDVSLRNLELAEIAVYGRNSFRGKDLAFRDRYFEVVGGGEYRPIAAVRDRVHFKRANLLDVPEVTRLGSHDIVFCRNLLIYFDRETQDRALDRLQQLLAPNGMLLVGPAESALPVAHGFVSAHLPMVFAFVRAPKGVKSVRPRAPTTIAPAKVSPPKAPLASARPAVLARPVIGQTATPRPQSLPPKDASSVDLQAASLKAIQHAANGGRLVEAREAALEHIRQYGPSADAHYHLGLVQDAEGNLAGAIQNYRKAIYLAPEHGEALAHLALLLQRQGDDAGAKALNSRLGRIMNRSGS
jgi:chemotaxis protein methyltransferase WspC